MKVELERTVAIQGMQENWILAIIPKYGNSAPDPQRMNSFGNFFPPHKLFAKKQWKGLGARRIF